MSAKYKVGDLVHVSTSASRFHEAKDWGICKIITLHQSTGEFKYKITLKYGPYSVVPNGIVLDRYVKDRPEDIKSIELLLDTGGYLCEDSNGDRVSIDENSIISLKEDN